MKILTSQSFRHHIIANNILNLININIQMFCKKLIQVKMQINNKNLNKLNKKKHFNFNNRVNNNNNNFIILMHKQKNLI
jgi:hypothetical protein